MLHGVVQQHKLVEHVDRLLTVVIYPHIILEQTVLRPHGPRKGHSLLTCGRDAVALGHIHKFPLV